MTHLPSRRWLIQRWQEPRLVVRRFALLAVGALLLTACGSSIDVADGYENSLLADPTAVVQGPHPGDDLDFAGLTPGPAHSDLDEDSLDETLATLFERGDGDQLFALKQALIPTAVIVALSVGHGDPIAFAPTDWLGHIDGRIDKAITDTDYRGPTTGPDIAAAIQPGLLPLVIKATGADPNNIDINLIVAATTIPQPVDGENDGEPAWRKENDEIFVQTAALILALHTTGHLQIPDGYTITDLTNGTVLSQILTVLGSDGKPLHINGAPVVVSDWNRELAPFASANSIAEAANR